MKRVLIADDDVLVCRFLSQINDWESWGYQLVGTARDGSQALSMIREQQPQILITDIEMPVMDGIELVRQVRKTGNRIKILILSCHDDVAHVKEGIRAGADEYFLKDELTGEKLLELLNSFSLEMPSEEEDSREEERIRREAEERHLQQLLEGTASEPAESLPDAVLAVHVTEYEERAALRTTEQREGFYRSFSAVLREQVPEKIRPRGCHMRGGWFALLLKSGNSSSQERQYQMTDICNRILHQADKQFELRVQIGAAELSGCGGDPAAAWEQARSLTGHGFYENRQIFCSWQDPIPKAALPQEAEEFLRRAEEWRIRGEREQIRSSVTAVLQAFAREKTREVLVTSWVRAGDELFRLKERRPVKKLEQLKELGREYAEACGRQLSGEMRYSDSIAAVIRYIRQNYREGITLNSAAEEVHLTPTYLSYMFHKETEVTFSEYLQNCRIDHAKELLAGTGEKVREIGELVGYNDYRHFCKTFKRVVGMTPQEYRKNRKQRNPSVT